MSKLFSPIVVGAVDLAHRVVLAPLTRMGADIAGNVPNDLMATYQGGLMITEASFDLSQANPVGVFMSSCRSSICVSDERGRIGQITLAILEFLSTENAIDLPFSFGLSSIARRSTHSSDG
jgi:hypothetical protein